MLRLVVVVVLLANLGWFAWSRGWLPAGWLPPPGDAAQREPQRLTRQVRADAVTVRPAGAEDPATDPVVDPATDGSVAGEAATCLQAGPVPAADWSAAVAAVEDAGVAPTGWLRLDNPAEPGTEWLRVPAADPDTARRLQALGEPGPTFTPCP